MFFSLKEWSSCADRSFDITLERFNMTESCLIRSLSDASYIVLYCIMIQLKLILTDHHNIVQDSSISKNTLKKWKKIRDSHQLVVLGYKQVAELTLTQNTDVFKLLQQVNWDLDHRRDTTPRWLLGIKLLNSEFAVQFKWLIKKAALTFIFQLIEKNNSNHNTTLKYPHHSILIISVSLFELLRKILHFPKNF